MGLSGEIINIFSYSRYLSRVLKEVGDHKIIWKIVLDEGLKNFGVLVEMYIVKDVYLDLERG